MSWVESALGGDPMRRFIFLALPLIAAALVSCATAPAQKAAAADPAVPAAAAEVAAEPPAAPSATEESIQPASQDQSPAQESNGVSLAQPATPQRSQQAAPEVDTPPVLARNEAVKFPLTSPQPPAPAVAPKLKATPAPKEAPVPKPAAQTHAAPAPAPTSATASSVPPTASPSTYGRLREIYARVGDDVQVGLDGAGFLFLGFPDRSPDGDGMSFKGKDTRDGKTWFTFKAVKLGTYDLDFLRQDNTSGTSSKETVRVHVVSDADFTAAVSPGPGQAPAASEPGDPAFADKLASLGQYDAAIAELLKGYRDGNPDLNGRIALLYMRTGSYDAAAKYFTKNLASPSPYGDAAVIGLTRVAIAQKDQPGFLSLLKKLLQSKDPGLEETLISAVRFETERGEAGLGMDLATEYAKRYPDGAWIDEADFILAQLLETSEQFRDITRARQIYSDLLREHPESAFAGRARDRVEYINRHFFQVR